jgi:FkbM family methyltransferase
VIRDRVDPALVTIVPARYGRMMVLKNDKYMGQAFIRYGEYSESEVELWRQLLSPYAIVADIGANIGAHTVAFSKLVPDGLVYAFEPLPFMYRMMVGNIALNGLTNVEPFQIAVGEAAGEIIVPAIDYTQDGNYGGLNLEGHKEGNVITLLPLDDLMPICHFIKADVEGMELAVLKGAQRIIRDCKPCLYLENNPGPDQDSLIRYVQGLGYDVWWHRAPHFNPNNVNGAKAEGDHEMAVASFNILCLPSSPDNQIEGLEFVPPLENTPPPPIENPPTEGV